MTITEDRPTSEDLTEEDFVERARALVPVLKSRRAQTLAERNVPAETIQDFKDAGFFKILQPPRWGGYDVPYATVARITEELAKGCQESAWVYGVLGIHNGFLSGYSEQAQQEVWGEDPSTLISSSYAPQLGADEEGGMRISGRWSFSSGVDHADWALIGGISPERGVQGLLVPKSDIEVVDDWHVLGMRGTGSKTLVLDNVFIPDYRMFNFEAIYAPRQSEQYPDSFWDNHVLGMFGTYHFSCVVAGMARRALELAIEGFTEMGPFGPRGGRETMQMRLSEAAADIEMTADYMIEYCRAQDRQWERREPYTVDQVNRHRRDLAVMVWRLRYAVEKLSTLQNNWMFDSAEMQALLRDVIMASGHRAANLEDSMLPWAASLLPAPPAGAPGPPA